MREQGDGPPPVGCCCYATATLIKARMAAYDHRRRRQKLFGGALQLNVEHSRRTCSCLPFTAIPIAWAHAPGYAMQFIPSSPPHPCPRCCRQLPRGRPLWWLHGGAEAVRCKSFCFCAMQLTQFIPSSPPHPCPRCCRQLPRGRPLWWLHGGAEAVRCKSFFFCAMQFIPSSPPYPCPRCCRKRPRGRHGYTGTGTISYCTMCTGLRTILL